MNKLKKELIRFLAFKETELNTYKKERLTFEGIVTEYMYKYHTDSIELESEKTEEKYDVDFDGNVMARFKGKPIIEIAMNGYGNPIEFDKIKIKKVV